MLWWLVLMSLIFSLLVNDVLVVGFILNDDWVDLKWGMLF